MVDILVLISCASVTVCVQQIEDGIQCRTHFEPRFLKLVFFREFVMQRLEKQICNFLSEDRIYLKEFKISLLILNSYSVVLLPNQMSAVLMKSNRGTPLCMDSTKAHAVDAGDWSTSGPLYFRGKTHSCFQTRVWAGPRVCVGALEKRWNSCLFRESNHDSWDL
jgi:hypothetical protein